MDFQYHAICITWLGSIKVRGNTRFTVYDRYSRHGMSTLAWHVINVFELDSNMMNDVIETMREVRAIFGTMEQFRK